MNKEYQTRKKQDLGRTQVYTTEHVSLFQAVYFNNITHLKQGVIIEYENYTIEKNNNEIFYVYNSGNLIKIAILNNLINKLLTTYKYNCFAIQLTAQAIHSKVISS